MSEVSLLECRWCGTFASVRNLKLHHGSRWAPRCAETQTASWAAESGYYTPGRDARVLDLAGLLVHRPLRAWYTRYVDVVDEETGEVSSVFDANVECISFEPFAPGWSIKLARRLMDDQDLVARLGGYKLEERKGWKWHRAQVKLGNPVSQKLVLPVEVRARLLRTAAASPMAREMFEDDALAAALIARDA